MKSKPTVFNYRNYIDLQRKYRILQDKHIRLQEHCAQLQKENTNLKIRLRIEEAHKDEI